MAVASPSWMLKLGGAGAVFEVDVSNETSRAPRSAAGRLARRINLERPLLVGDELGGHLVTGHIDGFARITERRPMAKASGLRWKPRLTSRDLSRRKERLRSTAFRSRLTRWMITVSG